jgi:hypothetical protein
MPTGTAKWFNPTKGYDFIQPQGTRRPPSISRGTHLYQVCRQHSEARCSRRLLLDPILIKSINGRKYDVNVGNCCTETTPR